MRWQNHIVIGASLGAVISPMTVPIAIFGATAPDWLEYLARISGKPIRHRTTTHVMTSWVCAVAFFGLIWDWHHVGLGFAVGGFSHVLADSFTVSGVPFSWFSEARFHLFGGKLRTGNVGEYIVAGACALLCAGWVFYAQPYYATPFIKTEAGQDVQASGFLPFFFNWQGAFQRGEVDAKEWRDNRLKFL